MKGVLFFGIILTALAQAGCATTPMPSAPPYPQYQTHPFYLGEDTINAYQADFASLFSVWLKDAESYRVAAEPLSGSAFPIRAEVQFHHDKDETDASSLNAWEIMPEVATSSLFRTVANGMYRYCKAMNGQFYEDAQKAFYGSLKHDRHLTPDSMVVGCDLDGKSPGHYLWLSRQTNFDRLATATYSQSLDELNQHHYERL